MVLAGSSPLVFVVRELTVIGNGTVLGWTIEEGWTVRKEVTEARKQIDATPLNKAEAKDPITSIGTGVAGLCS